MPKKNRRQQSLGKKNRRQNFRNLNSRVGSIVPRTSPSLRFFTQIPDFQDVCLYDVSFYDVTTVGASFKNQVFRGNSVFDPDETFVGGQPTGFDQMATLYSRYCVFASCINVEIINTSSNSAVLFALAPSRSAVAVGPSTMNVAEFPYSKSKLVASRNIVPSKLNHFMQTYRILGCSKQLTLNEDLMALTTTNPSTSWKWNIQVSSTNGTSDIAYSIKVHLCYYVRFIDRVNLSES